MSEEKRPLLIKITKKKDPSPFSRVFIETMPPCSPPNAPPRTSSEKGEKNFGIFLQILIARKMSW